MIPFFVIGGYLGAGKTTLLNHILETSGEMRAAVLVNDFGDINIDADLIVDHDGQTIEMSNGCVCCTIGEDLGSALIDLLRREPRPKSIFVEASGVADPSRIADYAVIDPVLESAGKIIVVDAKSVQEKARDKYVGKTVERQLKTADIFVLNKIDLTGPSELGQLRDWLRKLNAIAPVVTTEQATVDWHFLREQTKPSETTSQDTPANEAHAHSSTFATWTFIEELPIDMTMLARFFDNLPDAIQRAKGVLRCSKNSGDQKLIQWTPGQLNVSTYSKPSRIGVSKLVFIANNQEFDFAKLRQQLDACRLLD